MINGALAAAIAFHIALGILLIAVVWCVGSSWARLLLSRGEEVSTGSQTAFAYVLGLFALLAASIIALTSTAAGILFIAAIASPAVVSGVRSGSRRVRMRSPWRLLGVVLASVPITVLLSIIWRGPTSAWDSYSGEDAFYYGARAIAAARSVYPVHNLLVAGSDHYTLEMGPSYLAAALARWFGGDVFLVDAATLPILLFGSLFICLRPITKRGASVAVPLGLLLAFATLSPSSLPTSPPITLALPLAFALLAVLEDRSVRARSLAIVLVGIAFDLALTKVVGLAVLALVLCALIYRSSHRTVVKVGVAGLAITALAGISVGYVATRASYILAYDWHIAWPFSGVPGWHTLRSGYGIDKLGAPARTLGEMTLLVGVWRLRSYVMLLVLVPTVLFDLCVSSFSAVTPLALGAVMLVGWLSARPVDVPRSQPWLTLSAVLLGTSSWLIDPEPPAVALALFAMLLASMFAALLLARPELPAIRSGAVARPAGMAACLLICGLSFHDALGVAVAVVLTFAIAFLPAPAQCRVRRMTFVASLSAIVLVLGVGALRAVRLHDFGWQLGRLSFGHDDVAVWQAVKRRTPSWSIVFTDYYKVHGGISSYFGATGNRQIYFGAWQYTHLQADDAARARTLALNEEVLGGGISPSHVPHLGHGPFFAVLTARATAPPTFARIYGNAGYVLYRIGAAGKAARDSAG